MPLTPATTGRDTLKQSLRSGRESEAFLAALGRQVACYRSLAELSAEQGRLVAVGDTEGLLDVLTQRQSCTAEAASLEASLSPVKQDWPAATAAWPADRRRDAEALLTEARSLLAQITARDEQDALLLQQRKLEVGRQLRETEVDARLSRRINRTYAAAAYAPAANVDMKR